MFKNICDSAGFLLHLTIIESVFLKRTIALI